MYLMSVSIEKILILAYTLLMKLITHLLERYANYYSYHIFERDCYLIALIHNKLIDELHSFQLMVILIKMVIQMMMVLMVME